MKFRVASLYPLLYRLEKRGWIQGRWIEKAGQRRRRYYRLTPVGANVLASQRDTWRWLWKPSTGLRGPKRPTGGTPLNVGSHLSVSRPTREAEVVEKVAQHLDDRYEEMRLLGVPDDEARRDALAELDDADLVRELTGMAPPAAEPLALGGVPQAQVGGVWQAFASECGCSSRTPAPRS